MELSFLAKTIHRFVSRESGTILLLPTVELDLVDPTPLITELDASKATQATYMIC